MLNYIIQVILFQVLFLAVYDLFLSKETFFTKNRWYLLGTAMVSFLIPLIKIPSFQKAVPQEYTILLPEIVLSPQTVIENTSLYQSINYGEILFGLGCLLFFVIFLIKLFRIFLLINKHAIEHKPKYKLIWLPNKTKAFSFFNFIFLGKDIVESQKEKIIQHELVHSSQNHTADLLFFEFLKIVMWFNPMIWMYQNRITLVHEYISDEVVTKETTKENYINNILSDLFQVENISFINQFYKHSLIKKRIIMMTKEKSKQIKQLRYLLLIPVLVSMLFYSACTDEVQTSGVQEEMTSEKIIIHGKEYFLQKQNETTKIFDSEGNEVGFRIYYKNSKATADIIEIEETQELDENGVVIEDVPFAILDQAPTYPGCPEGDKDCFNKKMREYVRENFDTSLAKNLGLSSGKNKIYVQFKINKDGSITNLKARAPHPSLKEHAIKMMDKLPKLKPGLQKGKAVRVGYTLPISFIVE